MQAIVLKCESELFVSTRFPAIHRQGVLTKQQSDDWRRDALLLRLLKTPPKPRPKRVRDKAKLNYAKRAKAEKSASAT